MRHCISISNSNCYISEHPLLERRRETIKSSKKIHGTAHLFSGAPRSTPCSPLCWYTPDSPPWNNMAQKKPICLYSTAFVASKICPIPGFIFDTVQVLTQVHLVDLTGAHENRKRKPFLCLSSGQCTVIHPPWVPVRNHLIQQTVSASPVCNACLPTSCAWFNCENLQTFITLLLYAVHC